jgi:hydrophobe/amphiphile efflux-1 (HAE1) family protein
MSLSEFCIKRPVFATVLSLIIILVGLFAYKEIPTRATPAQNDTHILVYATYNGASQQLIETNITIPLEQAVNNIAGIDNIQSRSTRNSSQIQIEVDPDANFNDVVEKVRNQVEQVRGELPSNMDPPQVLAGGFNDQELVDIAFWSKKRSLEDIRDYINDSIFTKIQQIPGVSSASLGGVSQPAMRIWLNPDKMAALKITADDVSNAINNANQSLPTGQIDSRYIDYPISANTLLKNAEQFNNVVISNVNGNLIRVKDIARAELGVETSHQAIMELNGQPYVDVFVNYVNGSANPIEIGNQVDALLKSVAPQLPPDIHMRKFVDFSSFLRDSVREVYWTITLSIIFVCLVMFLFLGSFRAAFIPIVTIPICLMGGVALLYFVGLSLNTITLLAMVLSVGLIVDDSIVVVENNHRHTELGETPLIAAIKGSREISTSIIAMTLTLVAVFAPIAFIHGPISAFIKSFAFALAGSVLISGFIALTLSPTMCAYTLSPKTQQNWYARFIDKTFTGLDKAYYTLLKAILNFRALVIFVLLLLAAFGFYAYQSIPKNYFPTEDVSIIEVNLNAPPGANLNTISQQLKTIYTKIKNMPSIQDIALNGETGFDTPYGHFYIALTPPSERQKSSEQIADEINSIIKTLPGISAYAHTDGAGMQFQHGFEFALLSSGSYEKLANMVQQTITELKSYPGLIGLDSDMKFNNQQYQITINETMAGQLNISNQDINNALSIFLGGVNSSTKYVVGDKLYNIIIQVDQKHRREISALNELYVRNDVGNMIPLSSVINVKLVNTMTTLQHYDLVRAGGIFAQIAPGYSIGQVINDLQHLLPKIIPQGSRYVFVNAAHFYLQSSHDSALLFFAALIFIYLVLAALFESFVDPLTILLGVPLCVISAIVALRYLGGSINIFTQIGLVTLIGLIAKHGILITQFANNLQKDGLAIREAVIKAASIRLRPILMTTLAMIMGAIPLLLAHDTAGANTRHQLGIVIVFGLLFGTLFSLIVVPVAYTILHRLKRKN